ncbi:MAG: hypothetical protein II484_06295, partial [Bacteroidaceae bacterium]|nr:hypothetical protein [Bacteroidaceae bacterium]
MTTFFPIDDLVNHIIKLNCLVIINFQIVFTSLFRQRRPTVAGAPARAHITLIKCKISFFHPLFKRFCPRKRKDFFKRPEKDGVSRGTNKENKLEIKRFSRHSRFSGSDSTKTPRAPPHPLTTKLTKTQLHTISLHRILTISTRLHSSRSEVVKNKWDLDAQKRRFKILKRRLCKPKRRLHFNTTFNAIHTFNSFA